MQYTIIVISKQRNIIFRYFSEYCICNESHQKVIYHLKGKGTSSNSVIKCKEVVIQ